jgi:diguanylate cyclase (GGDEF)-like protein/PAS domain S-box-containing protein
MNTLKHHELHYLHELLNSSHIGILVVDKHRQNLFVNAHLCKMFGYTQEELFAANAEIFHVSHESFLHFSELAFDFVLKGQPVGIDYQFKKSDGTLFWCHIAGDIVQDQEEVLWTLVDITQRVQARDEVSRLKERMELALLDYDAGVYEWNIADNSAYFSPEWMKMLGYEEHELPQKISTWRWRIHPDERRATIMNFREAVAKGSEHVEFTHRLKHKNGQWLWILGRGHIKYSSEAKATRLIGIHTNITKQKARALKASHQAQIIEQIHDAVISTTLGGVIESWNLGAQNLLGYAAEDVIRKNIFLIHKKEDDTLLKQSIAELKERGTYFGERILVKKDGSELYVSLSLSLLRDEEGEPTHMVWYAQDITKRKKAEQKLQDTLYNLQQYIDVIDKIDIGLFVVNEDFSVRYMNSTMMKWFGDQIGKTCYASVANLDEPCPYCKLYDVIFENKKVIYEPTTPDGQSFDIVATSIKNADGTISKMEVIRNITDKKRAHEYLLQQKEALDHQAHHDALTQLPNRLLFSDRLEQGIAKAKRNNSKLALLFIDLDHFKEINDSLGHNIGDEVLKKVTKRLLDAIRKQDTIARLGGDEFTVIIEELKQGQDASRLAQKILEVLAEPIIVEENILYVSSSIGISLYPSDGTSAQDLLKYADSAMYRAKKEGRNNFQFYSAEMTELAFERVVMEASLRTAIKKSEFVVYYQPQVDAKADKIVGMEALVRWNHTTMGLVSPEKFIPLAEATGLIIEIDRFVMKTAMQQISSWYEEGLNPGVLALNLAMKQLQQKNFVETLKEMMQQTKCQPEWIELEVTEGQIMTNPHEAINILNEISSMGIAIAVDDFGTGYSSLSYLKKLPVTKLKIDQSFIRDLPDDEDDIAISKAVIALAQSLNLDIIAEGVERVEQKEFLLENGCELIQGYLYAKPMPADEMRKRLTKQ